MESFSKGPQCLHPPRAQQGQGKGEGEREREPHRQYKIRNRSNMTDDKDFL
jgi:hypothetical protein